MHLTFQTLKKSGAVFLYFSVIYSLILAANTVTHLKFVILIDNLLKCVVVIAQLLQ